MYIYRTNITEPVRLGNLITEITELFAHPHLLLEAVSIHTHRPVCLLSWRYHGSFNWPRVNMAKKKSSDGSTLHSWQKAIKQMR